MATKKGKIVDKISLSGVLKREARALRSVYTGTEKKGGDDDSKS